MEKFDKMPNQEQPDEEEKSDYSPEDSTPRSKGKFGQRKFEAPEKQ